MFTRYKKISHNTHTFPLSEITTNTNIDQNAAICLHANYTMHSEVRLSRLQLWVFKTIKEISGSSRNSEWAWEIILQTSRLPSKFNVSCLQTAILTLVVMQLSLSWNKKMYYCAQNYTGPAQSIPNTKYFHQIHFDSTLPCTFGSLKYYLHALWPQFCSSFSLGILFVQYDS